LFGGARAHHRVAVPAPSSLLFDHRPLVARRSRRAAASATSYSWWTAHNWKVHLPDDGDKGVAESMKYIDQIMVYDSVGQKIKDDLYGGNAVVLFAYGLSGSGKVRVTRASSCVRCRARAWVARATCGCDAGEQL
jgi:hypothetical protein